MSRDMEIPVALATDDQIEYLSQAILNLVKRVEKLEEAQRGKA